MISADGGPEDLAGDLGSLRRQGIAAGHGRGDADALEGVTRLARFPEPPDEHGDIGALAACFKRRWS